MNENKQKKSVFGMGLDGKNEVKLKKLMVEKRRISKRYDMVFARLDKMFVKGVSYSREERSDGDVCYIPAFVMNKEYRRTLRVLNKIQDQSHEIVKKIDELVDYDENEWFEFLRREKIRKEQLEKDKKDALERLTEDE